MYIHIRYVCTERVAAAVKSFLNSNIAKDWTYQESIYIFFKATHSYFLGILYKLLIIAPSICGDYAIIQSSEISSNL